MFIMSWDTDISSDTYSEFIGQYLHNYKKDGIQNGNKAKRSYSTFLSDVLRHRHNTENTSWNFVHHNVVSPLAYADQTPSSWWMRISWYQIGSRLLFGESYIFLWHIFRCHYLMHCVNECKRKRYGDSAARGTVAMILIPLWRHSIWIHSDHSLKKIGLSMCDSHNDLHPQNTFQSAKKWN